MFILGIHGFPEGQNVYHEKWEIPEFLNSRDFLFQEVPGWLLKIKIEKNAVLCLLGHNIVAI